jgi:hypothetical protein
MHILFTVIFNMILYKIQVAKSVTFAVSGADAVLRETDKMFDLTGRMQFQKPFWSETGCINILFFAYSS